MIFCEVNTLITEDGEELSIDIFNECKMIRALEDDSLIAVVTAREDPFVKLKRDQGFHIYAQDC